MALMKTLLTGVVALVGVFAAKAAAMAPLSDDVHTETAGAQELGSMTSDGFLVYTMNVCTIVQTTVCETSMSTGAPAPSIGGPSEPYEGSETTVYPVPTDEVTPSDNVSPITSSDGYTATITDDGGDETAIETATSTTTGNEESSGTASASATDTTDTDAPSPGSPMSFNSLAAIFAAMFLL